MHAGGHIPAVPHLVGLWRNLVSLLTSTTRKQNKREPQCVKQEMNG